MIIFPYLEHRTEDYGVRRKKAGCSRVVVTVYVWDGNGLKWNNGSGNVGEMEEIGISIVSS